MSVTKLLERYNDFRCGIYRHYKGGYYQVHMIGQHTSFPEASVGSVLVAYTALTGAHMPGLRVRFRPIEEFFGDVLHQDPVTQFSGIVKRFEFIGHEIPEEAREKLQPSATGTNKD